VDVVGDERREIVDDEIRSNSIDEYPESWEVYEVVGQGRVRPIADVKQADSMAVYDEGHMKVVWGLFNRISFPRKGLMTVETVYPTGDRGCAAGRECPRAGDRREYEYVPSQGRFVPQVAHR
jgi:hypothetical protein